MLVCACVCVCVYRDLARRWRLAFPIFHHILTNSCCHDNSTGEGEGEEKGEEGGEGGGGGGDYRPKQRHTQEP